MAIGFSWHPSHKLATPSPKCCISHVKRERESDIGEGKRIFHQEKAKEEVFRTDILQTSWGHSGASRLKNLGSLLRRERTRISARASMTRRCGLSTTPRGFKKLRSEKLYTGFRSLSVCPHGLWAVNMHLRNLLRDCLCTADILTVV